MYFVFLAFCNDFFDKYLSYFMLFHLNTNLALFLNYFQQLLSALISSQH